MDNKNNLSSLTAKMDALRAKGFSDDDINQILSGGASSPAVKTEEEKEYIEQWNERVDSVHKYEWFMGVVISLFIGFLATGLYIGLLTGPVLVSLIIGLVVVVLFFSFIQTNRIKEFFKKRL